MIQFDITGTKKIQRQLDRYMDSYVLSGDHLICENADECRSSCQKLDRKLFEGQLSHIGKNYCLLLNGKPLRVVIVGQEYGQSLWHVSTADRTKMIMRSRDGTFAKRNPHMRGTTSKLRLLFHGDVGTDFEGEHIQESHLFECMSQINFFLCSALKIARNAEQDARGGGKGAATAAMKKNCANHFRRSLEILHPTLVVIQGQGVRKNVEKSLQAEIEPAEIVRIEIGGQPVDVVAFDHPSAGGTSGYWGNSIRSRYLKEVIMPVLLRYRSEQFLR